MIVVQQIEFIKFITSLSLFYNWKYFKKLLHSKLNRYFYNENRITENWGDFTRVSKSIS